MGQLMCAGKGVVGEYRSGLSPSCSAQAKQTIMVYVTIFIYTRDLKERVFQMFPTYIFMPTRERETERESITLPHDETRWYLNGGSNISVLS